MNVLKEKLKKCCLPTPYQKKIIAVKFEWGSKHETCSIWLINSYRADTLFSLYYRK
jgi:hypothetical protein